MTIEEKICNLIYRILDFLFGIDNSLFDNKQMAHVAGGYAVAHIASLFFKEHYWIAAIVVAVAKEFMDHFIFGCGGNEIKHLYDILAWSIGGSSYYLIVILKRKKYNYK